MQIKIKPIMILLIFSSILNAQTKESYRRFVANNKNDLFPKILIYDGPQLPINYQDYLRIGFDYISVYSISNNKSIPNKYKYVLWTGVASNDAKAKWSTEYSPFVDDINQYAGRWNNRLNFYKSTYYNPNDKNDIGVMVLDIESKKSNAELESNPTYRRGGPRSKSIAISEYKTEMEKLYRYPIEFAKSNHNNYKIWSSYSDVPVERNWWGIPNKTWKEWTTNPNHLNYITHKTKQGRTYETGFGQLMDVYTVSTYFFYNPKFSNPNTANQYLAYLLFQLEVNRAWTDKPIYLYYYFKYQGSKERGTLISKDMVKNSVIFAFMSGADGMVLYDDSKKATNDATYHDLIKTFIESVSALDKYREYFKSTNPIFYKPDNARDLFVERKPIVRGIEKNGKILLAATNPFAKENEITRLPIYYKGKNIEITLKGKETYLKEIIL